MVTAAQAGDFQRAGCMTEQPKGQRLFSNDHSSRFRSMVFDLHDALPPPGWATRLWHLLVAKG